MGRREEGGGKLKIGNGNGEKVILKMGCLLHFWVWICEGRRELDVFFSSRLLTTRTKMTTRIEINEVRIQYQQGDSYRTDINASS